MYFDFVAELEPYMDRFEKARVVDGKLISCSPFRQDKHPSFVLFTDKGNWVDSGTNQKGSFAELLAFLTGEDLETVIQYLQQTPDFVDLELELDLQPKERQKFVESFQNGIPNRYRFRHPYLSQRGISEKVQQGFKIGYDKDTNAVVIPWTDKDGQIIRLMFRSVTGKAFWYGSEGDRIKNHLFGLYHVHRKNSRSVWIVEAPIDCLYLWTQGIPSVATGSASISREQVRLLKHSPIEEIVIASDNDEAGRNFANKLCQIFGGTHKVSLLEFPTWAKDVNDLKPEDIKASQVVGCPLFRL